MVVHGRVVEYGVVVIRWQRVLCNSVEEWDVVVICHQLIIARVPSTALGDCINRVFFFHSCGCVAKQRNMAETRVIRKKEPAAKQVNDIRFLLLAVAPRIIEYSAVDKARLKVDWKPTPRLLETFPPSVVASSATAYSARAVGLRAFKSDR